MSEPDRIGRYLIQELLGRGSYAAVYRAQDTLLKRTVALKVLKPVWARDREVSARFLREAQAAANLIHPQIAWVYDLGQDQGRNYIAARYVAGQPLDKYLEAHGALGWDAAVRVVEQVGSGLDYAHSQGIIHRDVKPGNILLCREEGAVLTDFGLTKALTDTQHITQAGSIVGTPQYIPPEVWNGEQAGPAADQYALGCIFFEMLTGKLLFDGQVIETILRGQLNASRLLDNHRADLPEGGFEALSRALAANPEDRYLTLRAFSTALRNLPTSAAESLPPLEAEDPGDQDPQEEPSVPSADYTLANQETQRLMGPSGELSSTGNLAASGEWRSRLNQVYQRINPLSTSTPRSLGAYRLEFVRPVSQDTPAQEEAQVLEIDREKVVLGRSSDCSVVVDYPDVSRQHATLLRTKDGYLLKDLRSTNGTFVNEERVLTEVLLKDGDEIRLGSSMRFVFHQTS